MYTFNDFEYDVKTLGISDALQVAINKHKASEDYKTALDADNYDRQKNTTISRFIKKVFTINGMSGIDTYSSNNKLCSSFFRRLNTQRNTYSLGNGIQFEDETIKEKLGEDFDTRLKEAGYYALIHGVSFMFWNVDHAHVYKLTEFVPLYDEDTGELKAGIRFWQIDEDKPTYAVLYEVDGYSKYRMAKADEIQKGTGKFEVDENKKAYRQTYVSTSVDEPEIVGEENYNALPIFALYGSRLKQSTLIGMKANIDAYDLVRSGFANDLSDCSEIYWLINGADAMTDKDMANFRTRLKINHIANAGDDDATVTPYTQEIPYNARKEFLEEIRSGIYEDFGGLDVHTISAGSTNDHIEAGYQPLDEQADDFEYEIIDVIHHLTRLIVNKEHTPIFNRNRISNQKERTDMIIECANYLDDETILNHLPFLTSDEVKVVLERKQQDDYDAFNSEPASDTEEEKEETEEDEDIIEEDDEEEDE